jgi:glycosyltransferase involved in cell wall biosynthesis
MARQISPWKDLVAVGRLIILLRQLDVCLVHANTPKGGLLGIIAGRIARVPGLIYQVHGLPQVTATGMRRWILMQTERISAQLARQVLCVSPSVRRLVVDWGLCGAAKVKVLGKGSVNGVDALGRFDPSRLPPDTRMRVRTEWGIPSSATVMGFVGRMVPDKGVTDLIGAWLTLRDVSADLHLVLVGPLEDHTPLPTATLDFISQDSRIHHVGAEWNTPPLYAAMDLVVLPTYREGLPVVPLEAAAMALPVIATDVPGCVDAVRDGITGTLVPAGDVDRLAATLLEYVQTPELRMRHGDAGRQMVLSDFRQESIWEATWSEYLVQCGDPAFIPDERL